MPGNRKTLLVPRFLFADPLLLRYLVLVRGPLRAIRYTRASRKHRSCLDRGRKRGSPHPTSARSARQRAMSSAPCRLGSANGNVLRARNIVRPLDDATIRRDGDSGVRRFDVSRSFPRTQRTLSLRHGTTGVPPATSTIGATGDRASRSRPAVRQLIQWQITVIIAGR
jgi:hypothetical protein